MFDSAGHMLTAAREDDWMLSTQLYMSRYPVGCWFIPRSYSTPRHCRRRRTIVLPIGP